MSKRQVFSVSHMGISVLYKCYKLPGYGKKCKDREESYCMRCRYCKAEMSGRDATKLLNEYGGKENV